MTLDNNNKKKKIKIEIEDAEGGKYNLSLEGNISKTKIMNAIELMELLNVKGQQDEGDHDITNNNIEAQKYQKDLTSLSSKIWNIIENKFPFASFTSSDILEIYRNEYHDEPISLPAIATYLSRYLEKGKLDRNKKAKEWVYKIASSPSAIDNMQQHKQQGSRPQGLYSLSDGIHSKHLNN